MAVQRRHETDGKPKPERKAVRQKRTANNQAEGTLSPRQESRGFEVRSSLACTCPNSDRCTECGIGAHNLCPDCQIGEKEAWEIARRAAH